MEGSELDGRSGGTRREPEGTQLGLGAEGGVGGEAEAGRGELEKPPRHPIVEQDGYQFYEVTCYSREGKSWIRYMPADPAPRKMPPAMQAAMMKLARAHAAERKAIMAMSYEDQVYDALESVAALQKKIIDLSSDDSIELDRAKMEKLRLGLQAGESVLNRALGKAVTKIDADVKHSAADQMATIDAEWSVEE